MGNESDKAAAPKAVHTEAEIRQFLQAAQVAVIATSSGEDIRLRMMHLGFEDDFSIYLASLHGDPKILQMTTNPSVSILVNRLPGDVTESEEVEYTGRAVLIRDKAERERCLKSTARTSPIVQSLMAQGNTGVLDCIKIVPQLIKYRRFAEIVQGVPPTVLEFADNRQVVSDWSRFKTKLRSWWVGIRPNSLAGVITPVVLGSAIAWNQTGTFHWGWFILTMLGALLLQAGTNVLNDYNDHRSGADAANRSFVRPFNGGSRVIQLGLLTPLETVVGASAMLLAAMGLGTYFLLSGRPWVAGLALFGALSGYFYNALGHNAIRAGLGELILGLNFGVLVTLGAFYVQTGYLAAMPAVVSVPVTLLITAVLFINQFQDEESDRRTGKPTLVVRLGGKKAAALLPVYFWLAFGMVAVMAAVGYAPLATLLALVSAPLAYRAATLCNRHYANNVDLAPANGMTALTHLTFGLMQALGYLASAGIAYVVVFGALFVGFAIYMYRYTERLRLAGISVQKAIAG